MVEDAPFVIFKYKVLGHDKCIEGIICYEGLSIDVVNKLGKCLN